MTSRTPATCPPTLSPLSMGHMLISASNISVPPEKVLAVRGGRYNRDHVIPPPHHPRCRFRECGRVDDPPQVGAAGDAPGGRAGGAAGGAGRARGAAGPRNAAGGGGRGSA